MLVELPDLGPSVDDGTDVVLNHLNTIKFNPKQSDLRHGFQHVSEEANNIIG